MSNVRLRGKFDVARQRRATPLLTTLGVVVAAAAAVYLALPTGVSSASNCISVDFYLHPPSPCDDRTHWSDGSGSTAWVTLIDRTPAQWPVLAAALEWDNAGRLDIIYRSNDCGGYGHCTEVRSSPFANDSCQQNPGFVNPGFSNDHFDGNTFVRFNDHCINAWTQQNRRVVVCQEEGHVAGVGHEPASYKDQTCMATPANPNYNINDWDATPRLHDFEFLDNNLYTHNDGS